MESASHELANTFEFQYIRDHEFAEPELEKLMKNDFVEQEKACEGMSEKDKKEIFLEKFIEDSGKVIKVITTKKGFGISAARDLAKGEEVMLYLGEICLRDKKDPESDYVLDMKDTKYCVDSKSKGNLSRYVNHSCDPNCKFVVKWFKEKCYAVLVTSAPIDAGVELTFDYKLKIDPDRKNFLCLCGAANCRKTFGEVAQKRKNRGNRKLQVTENTRQPTKKVKRSKAKPVEISEEEEIEEEMQDKSDKEKNVEEKLATGAEAVDDKVGWDVEMPSDPESSDTEDNPGKEECKENVEEDDKVGSDVESDVEMLDDSKSSEEKDKDGNEECQEGSSDQLWEVAVDPGFEIIEEDAEKEESQGGADAEKEESQGAADAENTQSGGDEGDKDPRSEDPEGDFLMINGVLFKGY